MKLVKILVLAVAAASLAMTSCIGKKHAHSAPAPEPGYVEYGK